ncbi:MAG: hypothetical protein AAB459_02575, partial [Patescibacteria group bacterium]
ASYLIHALKQTPAKMLHFFLFSADFFVTSIESLFKYAIYARHFLTSFDEEHASLFAHTWGYFAAALTWVLSHWLLFYGGFLAQPALLLSVIGFSLAALYYLDETDRLSSGLRRQFVFVMVAIVMVVMVFSDWGDKVV